MVQWFSMTDKLEAEDKFLLGIYELLKIQSFKHYGQKLTPNSTSSELS